MSQSAAKKNSTSAHARRGTTANVNSLTNWQSVTRFAATAMRREAGCVCVDLDSVILEHNPEDSHLGPVLPLGRKLVAWLSKKGWRVIVLTARAKRHQEILTYLHRRKVWADRVTNRKPFADAYFDDKAVRVPKNWK